MAEPKVYEVVSKAVVDKRAERGKIAVSRRRLMEIAFPQGVPAADAWDEQEDPDVAREEAPSGAFPSLVIPEGATVAQVERMEREALDAIDAVQDAEAAELLLGQITVAEHAVQVAKISGEHERRWGRVRLLAERRYGELLPPKQPGKVNLSRPERGGDRNAESRARQVAAVPQAAFDEYVNGAAKPTRSGLLRDTTEPKATPRPRKRAGRDTSPFAAYERLLARIKVVRSRPLAEDRPPRWTMDDADDVENVFRNLLKRRPKYSGRRLRELASKRAPRGAPHGLVDLQYRVMQLTSILESVDVADYDLADPETVAEFHDDLAELQFWLSRGLALAGGRLDDARFAEKLAKLRNGAGRTPEEHATALRIADDLERKRALRLE